MKSGGSSVTFAIIKPTSFYEAGGIISLIIGAGFSIEQLVSHHLTLDEAQEIYAPHKDQAFFNALCEYMCSGNVYLMRLHSDDDDAVSKWRTLMGATNPKDAKEGTIRKLYGRSLRENAVHGSDSVESAERELAIFEKIIKGFIF